MRFIKSKKIIMPILALVTIVLILLVIKTIKDNRITHSAVLSGDKKSAEISLDYTNFSKRFKDKIYLKVKNDTDELKVISIKWIDVENTIKYENKFLYEISCEGPNCNIVAPSQMPAFGFTLFSDIFIEPGNDQEYIIKITYKGKKDLNGAFKGKFAAVEEITDKDKYVEYLKEREYKRQYKEKIVKEYQDLDNE